MTVKIAMEQLRGVGITLTKNEDGEFEVRPKGAPASQVYYTDDLADAVATGKAIVAQRYRREQGIGLNRARWILGPDKNYS